MTSPAHKDDADKGTLRRHDLIVSALLWVISLFVFIDSFRMTFGLTLPGVEEKAWLVAPGLFPLILSAGLILMSSALIILAFKEGDIKGHVSHSALVSAVTNRETLTIILQMLLLCLFVFGLVGRVHFGLAAALYLFTAMLISRAASVYKIVIISVLFSITLTYVFGTVMKIPLP